MASSIASPSERSLHPVASRLGRVWRPIGIAAAAVVLASAGLALTRTGLFRVRTIEVEGVAHLSRSQVVRLSGITTDDNAVWVDRTAAEDRIDRNAWIAHAEVHVDLPWTVTMTITERSPIAVLRRPGAAEMLVAADGTILGPGRTSGLPVIDAPPTWVDAGGTTSVRDAAAALAALDPDLREMVRRVIVGAPGGLELLLADGIRVSLGPPRDFEEKARVARELFAWIARTGERVRAIDVSAPSAPAITPVA